ncbi:MAG: hypothetical protein V4565_08945 [Bacteroidota bacterium]
MKKLICFKASILIILFSACKKDIAIDKNRIVEGEIQFTINDNVTLKQSFNDLKSIIGDNEYELRNFYYTKVISPDSMTYYWHVFKNCSYIKVFNIFKKPNDAFTQFNAFNFKNLDYINYSKWDSIVKTEKLKEMPNGGDNVFRAGFLFVPKGKELIWINKLKELSIIKEANYVSKYYEGPM